MCSTQNIRPQNEDVSFPGADHGPEADCGRPGEGAGLLLRKAPRHRADLPGERKRQQPRPQQNHRHTLRYRGAAPRITLSQGGINIKQVKKKREKLHVDLHTENKLLG